MDFKQLETFVVVAKTGSFTKAAEKLFLSQPSVSGHISKLEEELGVLLFRRNNKKIELTSAGTIFYSSAREMLNQKEKTLLELNDYNGKIEGILEIGASNTTAQYIIPRYLAQFHKKYPNVVYNVIQMNSNQIENGLLSGELDFGLVGSSANDKNLIYERISEDRLVAIAPPKIPFINMEKISLGELLKYPMLSRREGSATQQLFESAIQGVDIRNEVNTIAYFDSTEIMVLAVQNGLGLAVVSTLAVEEKVKNGLLCSLPIKDVNLERSFYFAYHKKRTPSPLGLCFKEFILNEAPAILGA